MKRHARKSHARDSYYRAMILKYMPQAIAYIGEALGGDDAKSRQWATNWVMRCSRELASAEEAVESPSADPRRETLTPEALAAMSDDEVMNRLLDLLSPPVAAALGEELRNAYDNAPSDADQDDSLGGQLLLPGTVGEDAP